MMLKSHMLCMNASSGHSGIGDFFTQGHSN